MSDKTLKRLKVLTAFSFLLLIVNVGDKMWLFMGLTLLLNLVAGVNVPEGGLIGLIIGVSGFIAAGYLVFSTFYERSRISKLLSLASIAYCYFMAAWLGNTTLTSDMAVGPSYISYGIFLVISIACISGLVASK